MNQRPLIGISVGDPAGIGPEITASTLALPEIYEVCRPLAIGETALMKNAARIAGLSLDVRPVSSPADGRYTCGTMDVLSLDNIDGAAVRHGVVAAENGRAAYEYIERVIRLALDDEIDATVTGPINKEALNKAGLKYAGHTEIYAKLTNTRDYAMMLMHGDFRVIHVSTHVSLKEAIERVKQDRILKVIRLAYDTLRRLGIEQPRIGVAGLNPHAGEQGLFGREEIDEIIPAIEQAASEGLVVDGPIPCDTVFSKLEGGQYDIVVCMYHDQGHIPTKFMGFKYDKKNDTWTSISGVNITCGLPIIRVSVDHGTAFDRAGKGTSNPESMIQAVRLAARFASSR